MKFFQQKNLLRSVDYGDLPFYGENELNVKDERRDKSTPYIQFHESLTNRNGALLKELRAHLGQFEGNDRWDYPGYIANGGQVRAKMKHSGNAIVIRCRADIQKLGPRRQGPSSG